MGAGFDAFQSKQLEDNGFCLAPEVLDSSIIDRLTELVDKRLGNADSADNADLSRDFQHGSLHTLTLDDDPLPAILTSPAMRHTFRRLGFSDPRWISAYVVTKPPGSPGLGWHQDWWAWGHPRSYIRQPTQIFCLIYLVPTTPENGCLRVLPGSHLKRHYLHDVLPEPHTLDAESEVAESISHKMIPGELDIMARPGDLVIGDVRVIHATHPNWTSSRRTAIDLLFAPHFKSLPDDFKAHYVQQFCLPPAGWWNEPGNPLLTSPLRHLLPTYSGAAAKPIEFRRRPCWPDDHPVSM
jgi:hypothetical protein